MRLIQLIVRVNLMFFPGRNSLVMPMLYIEKTQVAGVRRREELSWKKPSRKARERLFS
jgi:hypothetical protein